MKISDIKPGTEGPRVSGGIISIWDAETAETGFGTARVTRAALQNAADQIAPNLWRDQMDAVGGWYGG